MTLLKRMTIAVVSLATISATAVAGLKDGFAWMQQVPAVAHMAQLRTPADLESAPNRSDFEATSMHILDALRSSSSDPSLPMHRVQSWLASNSPNMDCISLEDPGASGLDPTKDEHDAKGDCGGVGEEHACTAPALQTVESAVAVTPVLADSSQQPTQVDYAKSNQSTLVQQHTVVESPKKCYSEEAATQQASAAAAAATEKRQSAVHALVQRFEHMTVARLATSKPAGAALGLLLPPAPSEQAPQQGLSEDMMRLTLKREIDDEIHSNSSEGFSPRRELQSSRTALASLWDDYPCTDQPPEWHMNTVYQSESSSGEQAASGAEPFGPEGLAGAADMQTLAFQGSGEGAPRYAFMSCCCWDCPCTLLLLLLLSVCLSLLLMLLHSTLDAGSIS